MSDNDAIASRSRSVDLAVTGDRVVREHRSMKEALHRWQKNYEDEKQTTENTFKELEKKLQELVHHRDEETRRRVHVQEQNAELRVFSAFSRSKSR